MPPAIKWRFVGVLIVFLVWGIASLFANRLFLPAPYTVVGKLLTLAQTSGLYVDSVATIKRTCLGLLLGSLVGVLIGAALGTVKSLYVAFEFPLDFLRSIPATALFPLFIIIFGLGDVVKIFVAAWAVCFIMCISTLYGIRNVSNTRLLVAKLKKFSLFKTLRLITLPSALPHIAAGLRVSLSFSLIVELVAEMFLGSKNGLGHRVFNATSILAMEDVYATIIVIGCVGYILNRLAMYCEQKIVHWGGQV